MNIGAIVGLSTGTIVALVILAILIVIMVVLYIIGKRAEKKRADQEQAMKDSAQIISMLIIDKKKMRLRDAGLPQVVLDSTPKYLRRSKAPIVKAKIGPKVTTLIADPEIFEQIPVKREIKAVVSGLYITGLKGHHGQIDTSKHKKSFLQKLRKKVDK